MLSFLVHAHFWFIKTANSLKSPFLLIIRLFWGSMFFHAGLGKLLNMDSIIGFFQELNIPLPVFSAYCASYVEFLGGALLFLGMGSRIICIPLIFTMIVAFLTVFPDAVKSIFSNPQNILAKDPFSFFFASLVILIFGPGKFSMDHLLEKSIYKKYQ